MFDVTQSNFVLSALNAEWTNSSLNRKAWIHVPVSINVRLEQHTINQCCTLAPHVKHSSTDDFKQNVKIVWQSDIWWNIYISLLLHRKCIIIGTHPIL